MSIKLIPPGKRHGNKVYYAEIKVKGRRAEERNFLDWKFDPSENTP